MSDLIQKELFGPETETAITDGSVSEDIEGNEEENKELYVNYDGTVEDTTEHVPFNALTFEEYDESVDARKAADEFKKDANVFKGLVDNILNHRDVIDPVEMIRKAAGDFGERMKGILPRKEKNDISHGMNVFYSKERDKYLFLSTYSNNILDQDNPPEIIAEKSHIRFVKMVDSGEVPLPALCLWHIRSLEIGQTEVITYDKETGVAVAAGYFHKEAEPIAKNIAKNPDQWGVSHGMDGASVTKEGNIIVEHVTDEISPLPRFAAANQWASFQVLSKEIHMSIPAEKRKALNEMGISDDMIENVEKNNDFLAEQIQAAGIPTKEVADPPVEEEPKAEPTEEEIVEDTPVEGEAPAEEAPAEEPAVEESVPAEEPEAEPVEETVEPETAEPVGDELAGEPEGEPASEEKEVFTKAQMTALGEFGKLIAQQVVGEVKEMVEPLQKTAEEKAQEIIENQTPATMQELLFGPQLKQHSATVSQDTLIDGRSELGSDSPEETKPKKEMKVHSGRPVVDSVITDIIDGTPVQ